MRILIILLIFLLTSCLNSTKDDVNNGSGSSDVPYSVKKLDITLNPKLGGIVDGEQNVTLIPYIVLHTTTKLNMNLLNDSSIILSKDIAGLEKVALAGIIVSSDGMNIIISPAEALQTNTKYYVLVTDKIESPLNTGKVLVHFSFTTGISNVPATVILEPSNLDDVSLAPIITLMFSANIDHHTVNIQQEGSDVDIPLKIIKNNNQYTFEPLKELQPYTNYILKVGLLNSLHYVGLSEGEFKEFKFTTGNILTPKVDVIKPS